MTEEEQVRVALEVVELADKCGNNIPMKTGFYIWFAGYMSTKMKDKELKWKSIEFIKPKQWQTAKAIVFGEKFDFRHGDGR